jgi:hypothetical protein
MRRLVSLLVGAAALTALAAANARECRDDLLDSDGYTIRSVRVEGRWTPTIALPINPGDRFTHRGVTEAMRAVQEALRGKERVEFELQNLGAIGVIQVTRCLQVEGQEVDVVIEARSVRVALLEIGGNVLPIPRSALATFYNAVPAPLRALNPVFGAYQDKEYGFAPTAAISGNLTRGENSVLEFTAQGRKSLEHSFYDAAAQFAFSSLRPGEFLEQLALDARYNGKEEPQGDRTFRQQAGELGGTLRLRRSSGVIRTVDLGAHYRYAENRSQTRETDIDTSEHAARLRILVDGKSGDTFVRAAAWADGGMPDRGSNYARLAAMAAFEKEFVVAPNQTIGVEAIVGGGKSWSAPAYAEFYGGNAQRNFLYEARDSLQLIDFPDGPVLRSVGEGQALAGSRSGERGANAYWHVNLNISIPIPPLSAPLLPNEEVAGMPLRQLLKNKAQDFVTQDAARLILAGYSREEAMARAKATYGEVRPIIDFIADRANVYSLKPLLLCDVAGQDSASAGHHVQAAVGGGLQLTIVTAKMELGYMHTVAGANGDDSGNFFARIVFQNLF